MNKEELEQKAKEYLKSKTNQKDNLVITRDEAIRVLVEFTTSQTEQLKSKIDRDKEVTQANELVLLDRIKLFQDIGVEDAKEKIDLELELQTANKRNNRLYRQLEIEVKTLRANGITPEDESDDLLAELY